MKHNVWKTRLGFYFVAIGSACGLGNLWRFPYVVGENGGGAFVLLYVLTALVFGLPLLIGELMIGRVMRKPVLPATRDLQKRSLREGQRFPFSVLGKLMVFVTLLMVAFYAVISGWVLHFGTQFFLVNLGALQIQEISGMRALLENGLLQLGLASVHLIITVIIVVKGVHEGLEKWVGALMPLFVILLIFMITQTLQLPSSSEALRFLFYPDFSKLNFSSLIHAIGHVLFTLSVGFGTMVTFGSYLRDREHIPTAGFRVTVIDTFISLFAGLLIFPVALYVSQVPLKDPSLLFESLPIFFRDIPFGDVLGLIFFISLYLASLAATIGLFETVVSNSLHQFKISRIQASWGVAGLIFLISILPALSSSYFEGYRLFGKTVLELFDAVIVSWILPLIALVTLLTLRKALKEKEKEEHFIDPHKIESIALYPHWKFAITWLAPSLILLGLLLQFF
jgi:NSS family neurotransmitter:Na+ symporter